MLRQTHHDSLNSGDGSTGRRFWTRNQNDRQRKSASCSELGIGRHAARILTDKTVDPLLQQKCDFSREFERTATSNDVHLRHGRRDLRRINHADYVVVLRLHGKRLQRLAADREEDPFGRIGECQGGSFETWDFGPSVARGRLPVGAFESDQRNSCGFGCGHCMRADALSERMCRVDQNVYGVEAEVTCQTVCTTKATNARRDRTKPGRLCASGQRQGRSKTRVARQPSGKRRRFRCAAEHKQSQGHRWIRSGWR